MPNPRGEGLSVACGFGSKSAKGHELHGCHHPILPSAKGYINNVVSRGPLDLLMVTYVLPVAILRNQSMYLTTDKTDCRFRDMNITSEVHEFLTNLSPDDEGEEWTTKRTAEIADLPADPDRVEALRADLVERIGVFAQQRVPGSNISTSWQISVINDAAAINDLPMLEFFDRLMTLTHSAELLRIVLVHAVNNSIPLTNIDTINLDAYMKVTETMFRRFNTKVHYIAPDEGETLIARILSSKDDARNAIVFVEERGHNNPEYLIAFLGQSQNIAPSLVGGVL